MSTAEKPELKAQGSWNFGDRIDIRKELNTLAFIVQAKTEAEEIVDWREIWRQRKDQRPKL